MPKPARHAAKIPSPLTLARLGRYLLRAARLRCPECGVSPVFAPFKRSRTLHDWFSPLCGCPRCGYAYEREDGYFLLATWGVHYCAVAGFGLVLGLILQSLLPWNVWLVALITAIPTVLFGFAFVRHAKAIYLAIDHYFDPHVAPPTDAVSDVKERV